jgi:hypothetical protein
MGAGLPVDGGASATPETGSRASSSRGRNFYGQYIRKETEKERIMTPAFRRTAGRLALAAFATTALTGAAIAGGQAASASTSCDATKIVKTVDVVLTLRGDSPEQPQSCQ